VAQCIWWLASIIGLEEGLVKYIDNQQQHQETTDQRSHRLNIGGKQSSEPLRDYSGRIHPDRVQQITTLCAVLSTPRDLTEDQRTDEILERAANLNVSDLDLNATVPNKPSVILEST
jgi:hypothetical protein